MKKSLYIFLSSLLGALLFLIIHRILAFLYLEFIYTQFPSQYLVVPYFDILVIDYFTLIITSILGLWYGIWVGLSWYDSVYESSKHKGFVDSVLYRFWPTSNYNLKTKIDSAAQKMEEDLWELEELAKKIPSGQPVGIKKRIVRRKKTA